MSELVENNAPIEPEEMGEGCRDAIATPNEPATMKFAYHVTGERRKKLAKAISMITGMTATYKNAPTFAFAIGNYTVDKTGALTGKYDAALMAALAEQVFIAE